MIFRKLDKNSEANNISISRSPMLLYGVFGIVLILILVALCFFILNSFTFEKVYPGQ